MLKTHWTLSLTLLVTLLSFSGCATNSGKPEVKFGPRAQVYRASFDVVWLATQKALTQYPLRVNNMDLGLLETDIIKGSDVWVPPHIKKRSSGGVRYRLIVRLVKGNVRGNPRVKVTVEKKMTKKRDFFAKSKKMPSDGLEEKALLYRIEREIVIEKALQRAHDNKS